MARESNGVHRGEDDTTFQRRWTRKSSLICRHLNRFPKRGGSQQAGSGGIFQAAATQISYCSTSQHIPHLLRFSVSKNDANISSIHKARNLTVIFVPELSLFPHVPKAPRPYRFFKNIDLFGFTELQLTGSLRSLIFVAVGSSVAAFELLSCIMWDLVP